MVAIETLLDKSLTNEPVISPVSAKVLLDDSFVALVAVVALSAVSALVACVALAALSALVACVASSAKLATPTFLFPFNIFVILSAFAFPLSPAYAVDDVSPSAKDGLISTYSVPPQRYVKLVSFATYIMPSSPVEGKLALFGYSRTSST